MNKVTWIIFGAVIVLVLGGLVVYSRSSKPTVDVSTLDTNSIIAASDQNGQIADHVYGNPNAKVIFIEYGDFQCPSCSAAHPQIKAATEAYKDKVAFVFRNFPLTTIHPNARVAAASAEAAGLQGKYWEMHNLIYESQADWEKLAGEQRTNLFVGYAVELKLDEAKFKTDIASTAINNKISYDQAVAKKVGVEATPTFYLNGKQLSSTDAGQIVRGSTSVLTGLFDKALAE
ncbi:thioredoxin domain-containing protein [Candidatus Saccharibacteria bacterium]|nr:thioredoxin domain-containing protein [Candidatus Saccharibacteria bacterium]